MGVEETLRKPSQPSLVRSNVPSNNIRNPLKVDQTFLESFESTSVLGSSNINTPLVPLREKMAPEPEPRKTQANILGNGATIRDQHQENRRLETENYNLKIKLATFARFFDLSPEDQRKLLTENVDLKQQLMEKMHEIDRIRSEMNRAQDDKENTVVSVLPGPNFSFMLADRDDTIRKLNATISKTNEELDELRARATSLSSERFAVDDLHGKLEFMQNENQRLRRQLETLRDQLAHSHADSSPTRNIDDLRRRLQEAENDVVLWKDKHESLLSKFHTADKEERYTKQEMEKAWHEVEQAQEAYKTLRSDLEAAQSELRHAQSDTSNIKSKYESMVDEANSLKSQFRKYEHEIQLLQKSLRSKEADIQEANLERDGEKHAVSRLQSRIESLNEDLKEKELRELTLKKQINALMNDRDNMSNDSKAFQHQFQSMKDREQELEAKNKSLKAELEKVKQDVYLANTKYSTNDERLSGAYEEINELKDKLEFFESEYEKLEKDVDDSEREIQDLKRLANAARYTVADLEVANAHLKNKVDTSENTIQDLEAALEKLKRQVSEPRQSALDQLDKYSARQREEERIELLEEVDTLKYELSRIRHELSQQKAQKSFEHNREYESSEIRRLSMERSQLQVRLDEKDREVADLESRCRRLMSDVSNRDDVIQSLESRIRDATRTKKLDMFVEDEERNELLKEKASNESMIRVLRLLNENLQRELDAQVAGYKLKVDELMQSLGKPIGLGDAVSNSAIELLEKQVDEAQKTKHELSFKLAEANQQIQELETTSRKLEDKLADDSSRTQQLLELNAAFESNEKLIKQENQLLKEKTKRLNDEMDKVTKHCEKLAGKLRELKDREIDRQDSQDSRLEKTVDELTKYKSNTRALQRKIDDLSERLSATHMDTSRKTRNQFDLLQNELQFYRAKLYDVNLRANDLSLVNSFVRKAVNNSDKKIRDHIVNLSSITSYAEREGKPQKLTFASVAKFVLAAVRIRRRTEKSVQRQERLEELRVQIEKQRYFV